MHPGISDFPNRLFYRDQIVSAKTDAECRPPVGLAWPTPREVRYTHDHQKAWTTMPVVMVVAEECREQMVGRGGQGASYLNAEEARLAVAAAFALASGGDVKSVAILTPYKAQVPSRPHPHMCRTVS